MDKSFVLFRLPGVVIEHGLDTTPDPYSVGDIKGGHRVRLACSLGQLAELREGRAILRERVDQRNDPDSWITANDLSPGQKVMADFELAAIVTDPHPGAPGVWVVCDLTADQLTSVYGVGQLMPRNRIHKL
ncbi:hypothetical protein A2215_02035 [Candidatus Berkelbacteria bacterium RIFOXYA2_FULL_43_10]|uniref:Uncharacterized protein n=1 Tax=Candidatus Berkelbacteria bacterium RIFOXYA2_FULL_43_10 TaxID=1797472 RepID=A0A1F5E8G0_9BACT|nr:MAG: hypothetical protein A2215_02035 [Candidatus Berkelbacteria bacterium RIFOXYA2_FULL_43_10]